MMNHLLINSDDYGLHPLINDAVQRCVDRGIVNSVSVMANADYIDYGVLKYFQLKGNFVGVHLSWLGSKWLTAAYDIFSWKKFAWNLLSGGTQFRNAVRIEAEAQIERFTGNGIIPDHLDSHQHVHHFNEVWQITKELSLHHGIKRMRCCKTVNRELAKEGISGAILNRMARTKFNSDEHYFIAGLKNSGHYSFEEIENELKISAGVNTELIVHPGLETDALDKRFPHWHFDWRKEYDAIMDERLPGVVARNGFSLRKREADAIPS